MSTRVASFRALNSGKLRARRKKRAARKKQSREFLRCGITAGLMCLLLSVVATLHAGQTIPGVDIIVKKTGGKANVHALPNVPVGNVFQLNDVEWPTPHGIQKTADKGPPSIAIANPSDPPDNVGGGNWELDTSFNVSYIVELQTPGGVVPLHATGAAHVSGTGSTLTDWDGDGDFDIEDFTQFQLHGPIHQFDVAVDSFEVVDSVAGIRLRESPTLDSTAQILRRDMPGGQYRIASFFDVFTELSIDGGATWTPASSSLQFISAIPEPGTATLVGLGVVSFVGFSTGRRRSRRRADAI